MDGALKSCAGQDESKKIWLKRQTSDWLKKRITRCCLKCTVKSLGLKVVKLNVTYSFFVGKCLYCWHKERWLWWSFPIRWRPQQSWNQMQRQRRRNAGRLLQTHGTRPVHCQLEVRRPTCPGLSVRGSSQWRGHWEANRKHQEDEGSSSHHRSWKPM